MSTNKKTTKIKQSVKNIISFLKNPEDNFKRLKEIPLETILEDYMKGLLLSGFLAGLLSLIFSMLRALYLETFHGLSVEYLRLLNYSLGTAVGVFFFYLFIGTFGMIIIATLIWIFMRKIKYFEFIKIVCLAIYPVLLFSWVYIKAAPALLLWTLFNIVLGIKTYKKTYLTQSKKQKTSEPKNNGKSTKNKPKKKK